MHHILYASVRKVYNKKYDWWRLSEPAFVWVGSKQIIIPEGYETDFASKPLLVPDWLVPVSGLSAMASAAHDYLCETGVVSRAEADRAFLDLMHLAGVPLWQRWLMYGYVRAFGWIRYTKAY